MVGLAVELAQFGADPGADLPHEVFAAGEHRVGEHGAAVLADEDQVRVKGVDSAAPSPHVEQRFPAGHAVTVAIGADRNRVVAKGCRCRRLPCGV